MNNQNPSTPGLGRTEEVDFLAVLATLASSNVIVDEQVRGGSGTEVDALGESAICAFDGGEGEKFEACDATIPLRLGDFSITFPWTAEGS